MPSVALLANSGSGSGGADDVAGLLRAVDADVTEFEIGDWESAARSGAERIVVAGGDGSIGCAAAAARTAGVPLGVVAVGTANDFAAALELPTEIEAACVLAATGEKLRSMELGCAGGRPFVNVASIGLAPIAAEEAHGLKERLGALAYPVGAVKAGATAEPVSCRVMCDGREVHEGEAWQVSVSCTGAFGGGASMTADAGDGLLDLVVIEGSGRLSLAKHAYGMRIGTVEAQKGVIGVRCGEAELALPDGGCLNVDGELLDSEDLAENGVIRFEAERAAFDLVIG